MWKLPIFLAVLMFAAQAKAEICRVDDDSSALAPDGNSWSTAYPYLHDALANLNCTEIWVSAGVYYPDESTAGGDSNNPNISFDLRSDVAVYGGFAGNETALEQRDWNANLTVLSGDIRQEATTDSVGVVTDANVLPTDSLSLNKFAYHVFVGSLTDKTSMLDGFVITAGGWPLAYNGGGMYIDSGSPTLVNLLFSGNRAQFGGGLYNVNHSNPTLINVGFSGNRAEYGGGMWSNYSNPTLNNVIFSRNSAGSSGGGMASVVGNPHIANVTFEGNLANYGGGGLTINEGSPMLLNVSFVGNKASRGGGIFNHIYAGPTIVNATLSGNQATDSGGGIYNSFLSNPVLKNVILWGNTATVAGNQTYNWHRSSPSVGFSIYQDLTSGGNAGDPIIDLGSNIDAAPSFVRNPGLGPDGVWGTVDDDFGDLHLQVGSPAIDMGDNTALPADTFDLDDDGDTAEPSPFDLDDGDRIVNGVVEIGAYEFVIFDTDGDGVQDSVDNCPNDANPIQACSLASDCVGQTNSCSITAGFCTEQNNNDGDIWGDLCDADDDNDGWLDDQDNCPLVANSGQEDADYDGLGDACDATFTSNSAAIYVADKARESVDVIISVNLPGGNGMIAKLTGNGGVVAKLDIAIIAFETGLIDVATYESELEAALDMLDAFDNQLAAKINNGNIVEPGATVLLDASADIREAINNLIASTGA